MLAEIALSAVLQLAQQKTDAGKFSGVLLVAKDGKPVAEQAYGMADETHKNTVDTKFNIGSINKAFTKRAIEQLVDAKKFALDDPVRKVLPDYPSPVADRITIRQLLEHRSGLGDIFGPRYDAAPPSKLRELSDFLPLFADQPLQFEPGSDERYSNAGYIVLGLIIERVTGQKYRDYVQQHIFVPAGMKNTGFWAIDETVANRATGYTHGKPNSSSLPGRPSSAGGAYSTAEDLLRFTQWLGDKGIFIAGGAPGLNAAVNVEKDWTIIALANLDPPAAIDLVQAVRPLLGIKAEGGGHAIQRGPMTPDTIDIKGPTTVPLTPNGHLFAVDAKVNGKGPFAFVIDTGAGGLMRVSPDLAKTLALEPIGEARAGDPSGKNLQSVAIVHVDSVQIGNATFGGIQASIGRENVIGLGLFGRMLVTLDFPKKELRLGMGSLPASGPHIISYTNAHGIPQIDIDVAGVTMKADVDSGSPALLNIPASTQVPFNGELRVVGRGRTVSNEFEIKAGEVKGDAKIAGWTLTNPTVDVTDIFPVVNLGSRFLREHVVMFDLANQRLSIE